MRAHTIERALWASASAALVTAFAFIGAGGVRGKTPLPITPAAPRVTLPPFVDADTLEAAVGVIAAENLFRAERSSADTERAAATPVPGQPMVAGKPKLILRGVLGGPPWDALIDGVPGHDGALVVRVGQTVAGFTVRAVRRDTVFIRGFDTTWALTLGRR